MSESAPPRLPKWPFIAGDLCLLFVAWAVVHFGPAPLAVWQYLAALGAVAIGAAVCALPFVLEHRAALYLATVGRLADTLNQIQQLEQLAAQVTGATARWQTAQDAADKTAGAAKSIAEKINAEATAFQEFLQKANDSEKAHLRLEVEKLQRAQGEWLQLAVRTLDHVFALHQAGLRSNQPTLVAQLGQFQATCRDLARRLGIVTFAPQCAEPFDEKLHQLPDPEASTSADARVGDVLAPGYNFQGQLLRKATATLFTPATDAKPAETAPAETQP
jgi:molecular chaperone GrpE (heat shock protein)